MIAPEAGHQKIHYLGTFSYGYTRMAFHVAERGNFKKEISTASHYELYKIKPRTAQDRMLKEESNVPLTLLRIGVGVVLTRNIQVCIDLLVGCEKIVPRSEVYVSKREEGP